jgi:hypothetical protein
VAAAAAAATALAVLLLQVRGAAAARGAGGWVLLRAECMAGEGQLFVSLFRALAGGIHSCSHF